MGTRRKTEANKKMVDLFETAMNLEITGLKNYLRFARETENISGKNMFVILANDELDHYLLLKGLKEKYMEFGKFSSPQISSSIVEKLFPKISEVSKSEKSKITDLDALNLALKLEENSREFYLDEAKKTKDPNLKDAFERLAQIEDGHYRLIRAEIDSITKSGFWMDIPEFTVETP